MGHTSSGTCTLATRVTTTASSSGNTLHPSVRLGGACDRISHFARQMSRHRYANVVHSRTVNHRRKVRHLFLPLLISSLLTVAGTVYATPTTASVHTIATTYASGYFRDVWTYYLEVMRIDHQDVRENLLRCIDASQCPPAWPLVGVTGLSSDDASFIAGFCAIQRSYCERLSLSAQISLLLRPVDRRSAVVPLASGPQITRNIYGNLRPRAKFSLGDYILRGLVDTGATNNMAFSGSASKTLVQSGRPLGEVHVRTGRDVVTHATAFVVPRMDLGSLQYQAVPMLLDDREVKPSSITNVDTIGITTILRHQAVCFSWRESLLYLGHIGPCEVGHAPYGARFGAGFSLLVELRQDEQAPMWGIVDTGADHTACPYGAEISEYQFGPKDSMRLNCHGDDLHSIVIGMDTLARFAAFGWELDPLRVYFVPFRSRSG